MIVGHHKLHPTETPLFQRQKELLPAALGFTLPVPPPARSVGLPSQCRSTPLQPGCELPRFLVPSHNGHPESDMDRLLLPTAAGQTSPTLHPCSDSSG